MQGPRLTEERLRYHLDSNQPMRERMCLALLPLLGPFTREQPRRPKGGPDGARDIEAVHQGQTTVWGAVGFKNGGGVDDDSRKDIETKFKDDLNNALRENVSLAGFVFFTNVDLTPGRRDALKRYGHDKGVAFVEIFDMEQLRHVLDSPEGLIARLQYLDIPMSATEQAALVGKFGTQLQNAVTARFDRVERTLAEMERFLSFQKPILRIDVFIALAEATTSAALGDEAAFLRITGLHDLPKTCSFLATNHFSHPKADSNLLTLTHMWNEDAPDKILTLQPSVGSPSIMASFNEISLTAGGNRVRIADLTLIGFEAICTEGIRRKIRRIAVDANGYELVDSAPDEMAGAIDVPSWPDGFKWPEKLPYNAAGRRWQVLVSRKVRNLFFDPPRAARQMHRLNTNWTG
ncbi:MAG TPA: hypothetical protein VM597_04600 [Gemmataceae bacterium]|nr:hypothetical protein [Gemmataceae bacterium]